MANDQPRRLRVFTGGVAHETHSFSTSPTPEAAFRAYEWAEGDEILGYRGTRTSLGGVIDGAAAFDVDLAPGFYTFAIPSGVVPKTDFEAIADRFLQSLEAELDKGPLDGIILVCHGAMVAAEHDDVEGELAERVRAIAGAGTPIVMTLDYHANISAKLAATVAVIVGYDTYPHVDVYERGFEAVELLRKIVESPAPVAKAFASVPVLSVPQRQGTEDAPMKAVMARAHAFEADPKVLAVTVAGGFCYSDVPRAGMAIAVSTLGKPDLATRIATELHGLIWARRDEFLQTNAPVADAVRRAMAAPAGRPVILVDVADNIGGGAPGDGTALLAEMIAQGATGSVVVIADPEAVALASAAGVDGAFDAPVGGKTDAFHGPPVRVRGRVRLLSDGRFVYRGSYMTGQLREMGRTAVIDAAGLLVVVTERKTMPFDAEQLRSVGISPEICRAIVVKAAVAWRAGYLAMAGEVIEVDTPGICTANLATLPYQNLTRPIFPLDRA